MRRRGRWISVLLGLLLALVPASAWAQETPLEIDWATMAPLSGTVVDGSVEVTAGKGGGEFPLVVIEAPGVGAPGYEVAGEVRYDQVQGQSYVEMWSVFEDGERYFSRTLEAEGPAAVLTGTSDWREFRLPFFLEGDARPTRLEINLVLAGRGTVQVGPLHAGPLGAVASGSGWWSDRAAAYIGAVGGSLLGIVGALMGWLVSRRRARGFVLVAMAALAGAGGLLLSVGVLALLVSQPYAVYYPLLLFGGIMVVVFGTRLRTARRAFADAEMRRMRAFDGA